MICSEMPRSLSPSLSYLFGNTHRGGGVVYRPVSAQLEECGAERGKRGREEEEKINALKYFSPPPATQRRPRVLTAACLDTAPLNGGGGGGERRAGMRKTRGRSHTSLLSTWTALNLDPVLSLSSSTENLHPLLCLEVV